MTGSDPGVSTVVIIGNFDGVHRGHQALIRQAKEIGMEHDWPVAALTFEPHPAMVLRPNFSQPYLITPSDLKLYWLEYFGVDYVRVLTFNRELAAMPALGFLTSEVSQNLGARAVVVGYNFTFGAGGRGTANTLREWGESSHVAVRIVAPVNTNAGVVSSSAIRQELIHGRIAAGNDLLGHAFSVQAPVRYGEGRGGTIGIPTLNMIPHERQIMPPFGVYAGYLGIVGSASPQLPAVANWGVRPTFGGSQAVLEVHVIDQTLPDLHGRSVRLAFAQPLRHEQKFDNIEALIRQIHHDIRQARQLL